ncbi:DUF4157 domain-containing protein [uncultured Aquimarina sp.]|uniref:eCIS core domain-containing protein n=1 Tax=uncultured Aquimarina sp. TaxID=575652 RepID=UPI00260B61D0|nr:DUF4157 domain-containing protein [uncultured Aquimarina sp.]
MKAQTDKTQELQNSITPRVASEASNGGTAQLKDNRTSSMDQRMLKDSMNSTSNSNYNPIQRKIYPERSRRNNTGLPDTLKSGIENLSGYSMDDVNVHYNSSKPAQLQAHAYAQGTDIHLAPGQEKHLPHEAWHVVQQKQDRVKPTRQLKSNPSASLRTGVNINDDVGLEKEADVMGAKALQMKRSPKEKRSGKIVGKVVQRKESRAYQTVKPMINFVKNIFYNLTSNPSLASILYHKARSLNIGLRELEVRLNHPGTTLGSKVPDAPNLSGRNFYDGLIGDGEEKLRGSCGQTSNLIKDLTFKGNDIEEFDGAENVCRAILEASDNTFIRVQIGCHSFIVEKRKNKCRVYQSYMGFDALADTIPLDKAISTREFVNRLWNIINNPESELTEQMFHGEVDPTRGNVKCEVPQERNNKQEISDLLDNTLSEYEEDWDFIKDSDLAIKDIYFDMENIPADDRW